jgi:hypothetical protein
MMLRISDIIATGGEGWQANFQNLMAALAAEVSKWGNAVGDVLAGVARLQDQSNAKEITKNKKKYDADVRNYKNQLDRKMLTQDQYDAKVAASKEEMDKKQRKLERENAIRQKKLAIFSAVINTAQAILAALASSGPPMNFIMAALVGIAGGLQIAAIAKEPLPELGKGTRFKGAKHPFSTMTVAGANGSPIATVEEGETLLSSATYMNNPALVDALLDASMNNDGKVDFPEMNAERASETSRMLRSGAFPVSSEEGSVSSGAREASGNGMMGEVANAMNRLAGVLEQGVEAKLVHRTFKRDLKLFDKITGGR